MPQRGTAKKSESAWAARIAMQVAPHNDSTLSLLLNKTRRCARLLRVGTENAQVPEANAPTADAARDGGQAIAVGLTGCDIARTVARRSSGQGADRV